MAGSSPKVLNSVTAPIAPTLTQYGSSDDPRELINFNNRNGTVKRNSILSPGLNFHTKATTVNAPPDRMIYKSYHKMNDDPVNMHRDSQVVGPKIKFHGSSSFPQSTKCESDAVHA